jgi:hypothetical protein
MKVCIDSKDIADPQIVEKVVPELTKALNCYESCNYASPCREVCQKDFMDSGAYNYVPIEFSSGPTSCSIDTSEADTPISGFLTLVFLLYTLFRH